ncbi:hypothetical protein D3C76_1734680 [compost metagenome]
MLRNIRFTQHFGDVEVNEGRVLVVDHWRGALGVGKGRAGVEEGGEKGGESEDMDFHDGSLFRFEWAVGGLAWQ